MRVVIQRVSSASVSVDKKVIGACNNGLLILAGIEDLDTEEDAAWLSAKIVNLRIFNDAEGKMNLALKDINGEILVVSQFTLHASTKKGNRPSYILAARPEKALPLFNTFVEMLKKESGRPVATGEFGAHMEVSLVNEGPVTIIIDTKNKE
ncbi:MAG TPA: D-aminoacyl-tRNA deacylase [Bacteroidia bacterium]|jgi:D-tyrosyl-tRNA(Tyr) deacylase|nr:D-aminoacyl-tRNA deacylase [Bacteroidia bacterium]